MLKIAANISLLFRELPMLERFHAARVAGFDGVEIQFPYGESVDDLRRAARDNDLPVVLINAPILPDYPYGLGGRPEMLARFRSQLAQILEYAEGLEVRHVHVLAGRCDPPENRQQCLEVYQHNLLLTAEALAPQGVGVLVEALNPIDVPDYLIGSLDEAVKILERCRQRVRLQLDAYHVTRMGLDAVAQLSRLLALVGHVQFADVPGRHEPGTGTVDFAALLSVLKTGGYAGWLAAEYLPAAQTPAGLAWLARWREAG